MSATRAAPTPTPPRGSQAAASGVQLVPKESGRLGRTLAYFKDTPTQAENKLHEAVRKLGKDPSADGLSKYLGAILAKSDAELRAMLPADKEKLNRELNHLLWEGKAHFESPKGIDEYIRFVQIKKKLGRDIHQSSHFHRVISAMKDAGTPLKQIIIKLKDAGFSDKEIARGMRDAYVHVKDIISGFMDTGVNLFDTIKALSEAKISPRLVKQALEDSSIPKADVLSVVKEYVVREMAALDASASASASAVKAERTSNIIKDAVSVMRGAGFSRGEIIRELHTGQKLELSDVINAMVTLKMSSADILDGLKDAEIDLKAMFTGLKSEDVSLEQIAKFMKRMPVNPQEIVDIFISADREVVTLSPKIKALHDSGINIVDIARGLLHDEDVASGKKDRHSPVLIKIAISSMVKAGIKMEYAVKGLVGAGVRSEQVIAIMTTPNDRIMTTPNDRIAALKGLISAGISPSTIFRLLCVAEHSMNDTVYCMNKAGIGLERIVVSMKANEVSATDVAKCLKDGQVKNEDILSFMLKAKFSLSDIAIGLHAIGVSPQEIVLLMKNAKCSRADVMKAMDTSVEIEAAPQTLREDTAPAAAAAAAVAGSTSISPTGHTLREIAARFTRVNGEVSRRDVDMLAFAAKRPRIGSKEILQIFSLQPELPRAVSRMQGAMVAAGSQPPPPLAPSSSDTPPPSPAVVAAVPVISMAEFFVEFQLEGDSPLADTSSRSIQISLYKVFAKRKEHFDAVVTDGAKKARVEQYLASIYHDLEKDATTSDSGFMNFAQLLSIKKRLGHDVSQGLKYLLSISSRLSIEDRIARLSTMIGLGAADIINAIPDDAKILGVELVRALHEGYDHSSGYDFEEIGKAMKASARWKDKVGDIAHGMGQLTTPDAVGRATMVSTAAAAASSRSLTPPHSAASSRSITPPPAPVKPFTAADVQSFKAGAGLVS